MTHDFDFFPGSSEAANSNAFALNWTRNKAFTSPWCGNSLRLHLNDGWGEFSVSKPGDTGIRRILRAFTYSKQGFVQAWQHEAAFRQEVTMIVILIPIAIWLAQSALQFLLLFISGVLVVIVELLNSALEAAIDRFGGEIHELSGRAKDMGSAAVLLSFVILGSVWAYVAYERFCT